MIDIHGFFKIVDCIHMYELIKRDFGHGLTMWLPECTKCHFKAYQWEWRKQDE